MSFLRPEAVAHVRRWLETGVAASGGVLVLWSGVRLLSAGSWLGWLVLAAFGPVTLLWLRTAYMRARLAASRDGPGMVIVDERRIGYLGPKTGGFADLESLTAIDVMTLGGTGAGGGKYWVLHHRDGPPVFVPVSAEGAEALPEALSALSGFSTDRVLEALADPRGKVVTIWRTET